MDEERRVTKKFEVISATCPFCGSPLKRATHPGDHMISECDLCKLQLIFRNAEWQDTDDPYEGPPLPAAIPERVEKLERFINDHGTKEQ